MGRLRIAVAQINAHVGDIDGNAARILEYARRARDLDADLLLTPELALCGYPPEDLLMRPDFYQACAAVSAQALAAQAPLPLVVGHLWSGTDAATTRPRCCVPGASRQPTGKPLPNYEVFDEERYFDPARHHASSRSAACAAGWRSARTSGSPARPSPRRGGRTGTYAQRVAFSHEQAGAPL